MAATVTSGIKLRYRAESTFGTPPGGTYQEVRFSGETKQPNLTSVRSAAIRADGQTVNVVRTDAEGGGPVSGELAYSEWDDWFEWGLLSDPWTPSPLSDTTSKSTVVAAAGVPSQIVKAGGTFIADGWKDGMVISMSAHSQSAMNDMLVIVHVVDTILYVTGNPNFTTESAEACTIAQFAQIANGITGKTMTLEREDADDTDEFHQYAGVGVQTTTIEFPATGIITTTFDLLSKVPKTNATSDASGNTAAPTTDPMTADRVFRFLEGDPDYGDITANAFLWDVSPFQLLGATFTATPSLRTRKAMGTVGPAIKHGRGEFLISGSLRMYYNNTSGRDDKVLMDKVLNDTVSAICLMVKDASKNMYALVVPKLKFTTGRRNAPAKSQDVILEVEFEGYLNSLHVNENANVAGTTFQISRGISP